MIPSLHGDSVIMQILFRSDTPCQLYCGRSGDDYCLKHLDSEISAVQTIYTKSAVAHEQMHTNERSCYNRMELLIRNQYFQEDFNLFSLNTNANFK